MAVEYFLYVKIFYIGHELNGKFRIFQREESNMCFSWLDMYIWYLLKKNSSCFSIDLSIQIYMDVVIVCHRESLKINVEK